VLGCFIYVPRVVLHDTTIVLPAVDKIEVVKYPLRMYIIVGGIFMSIFGDPGRRFPTFTIKRKGRLLSMPVESSLSPIYFSRIRALLECLFSRNVFLC
jgi:hypothetical protein